MNVQRSPQLARFLVWGSNLAVFALLGAVGWWGHASHWSLPKLSDLVATHATDIGESSTSQRLPATSSGDNGEHAFPNELPAIEFASADAARNCGIEIGMSEHRAMDAAVVANGVVDYDQTHLAQLAVRVPGIVARVDKRVGDTVSPELRTVPGIAEINTWGGLKKQYQVKIDPALLFKFELTFQQVVQALQSNNLNVGGGYMDRKGDMLLVHGIARTISTEQIGEIQVAAFHGVPVYVKDVAEIAIGHELRRGLVTADGQGEVLLGLGFMRIGENSYAVTEDLSRKFEEVRGTLPEGLKSDVFYERTDLVKEVIGTVRNNLCEGALLVVAIPYLFLGNLRAGLIAAAGIPLCVGFFPMATSTGMGAEVQRPLATVVIGGVATSMLMTLFLVPIMYASLPGYRTVGFVSTAVKGS